jgi:basic membrane protein A
MRSNGIRVTFIGLIIATSIGCNRPSDQKPTLASGGKVLKVVLLLAPSGKGDKSYNDMAIAGLAKAREGDSLDVVEMLPTRVDDYGPSIRRAADRGADLIIGVGFLYTEAIGSLAKEFPNVKFVLIDGQLDGQSNVLSVVFRPQEGSFLVGVAAGMATTSAKVGFIGGMDIPIMQTFACGYREGVEYAASVRGRKIAVTERFIGGTPDAFSNPGRGHDMARLMYDTGIDVIYHAAGASGNGVIQAARDTNHYVIGVDTDQSYLAPKNVMTSMRKRIDLAIEVAITDIKQEIFVGGVKLMNLQNGGVDYVTTSVVSNDVWKIVEEAKGKVLNGSVLVCPQVK